MPLSLANEIIYGSQESVETFLTLHRPDVNKLDEYGYTPLIETAIVDDIAMTQLLLDHGADVNLCDEINGTALQWAVENNNIAMCHLLLERGADPNLYNIAGQPPLVKALLRKNKVLKELLMSYGASLQFAQDYTHTKLLAHRFELIGRGDIVDPQGRFFEIDYEGFILEFTVQIIRDSLMQFRRNFAGRSQRHIFEDLAKIIAALRVADRLLVFQHHLVNVEQHAKTIKELSKTDPIILPISQEGHAITLVKCGNLVAICDRAEYETKNDDIIIYYANRPVNFDFTLIKELVYKLNSLAEIKKYLDSRLSLQPIHKFTIGGQITGNCSWANVEACVPVLYLMLVMQKANYRAHIETYQLQTMDLYLNWREWDKERALGHFITEFRSSKNKARKACIAEILGAVLFQCCFAENELDLQRAKKIIPVLKTPGYQYILDNYLEIFTRQKPTEAGANLKRLIQSGQMGDIFS